MNIVLNDPQREYYAATIRELALLCPETIVKKIPEANVQQAFVLATVKKLATKKSQILSVGSYEDTAAESLIKLGYSIYEIDPETPDFQQSGNTSHILKMNLHQFRSAYSNERFDLILSTSVIEHVENDEEFIDDMCNLLNTGGYGVLTCDFNDSYRPGSNKPSVDYRLYTKYDLLERLNKVLFKNNCKIYGKIDYQGAPDFNYFGCIYTFATLVFKKA